MGGRGNILGSCRKVNAAELPFLNAPLRTQDRRVNSAAPDKCIAVQFISGGNEKHEGLLRGCLVRGVKVTL
jgi:hypothetical protein